ncbi:autotransporter domain-containing protein [Actinobacillus equuli]|uniref:autotransporter domain-containing protein n=1 Tax=Actinobacillus equuli TaxID=718 RepID=UPI0024424A95|nr:autotransporter domain-containing protein [Actinobacillus equuli]WGE78772.1 autotransporter domain-containing protein [Actinobacillus equuli subsp. equuli]
MKKYNKSLLSLSLCTALLGCKESEQHNSSATHQSPTPPVQKTQGMPSSSVKLQDIVHEVISDQAKSDLSKELLTAPIYTAKGEGVIQYQSVEKDQQLLSQLVAEQDAKYQARLEAEKQEAERQARLEAEKQEAERQARLEAEKQEAERQARLEAEKQEAERQARLEAEKQEAERQARLEAEKQEAERQARLEAEKQEAERQARLDAEKQNRFAASENVRLDVLHNVNQNKTKLKAPKIAVIDTAFSNQESVVGNIFGNRMHIDYRNYFGGAIGDKWSHGVLVSTLIAKNNANSHLYGYTSTEDDFTMNVQSGAFNHAYNQGVRLFNLSFGVTRTTMPTDYYDHLNIGRFAKQNGIFMLAAGNERSHWASNEAHIVLGDPEIQNGWLIVSSVPYIGATELADYSNRIGEKLKNYGIAAQGNWQVDINGFNRTGNGTSFATPIVTAVVGNVWEKFSWYDNHLAVMTVLSTASKPGKFEQVTEGSDDKFGWGIINQERALKGIGRFDTRLMTNRDDKENKLVRVNVKDEGYSKDQLTWSNDIAGDAGLLKEGNGALFLTGNNQYQGKTVVREGVLGVSGSLQSDVQIEKDGSLYVKNTEQAVNFNRNLTNAGSLYVYGKGARLKGDYIADKQARLVIDIDKSDLTVEGKMQFNGSRIVADIENIDTIPSHQAATRKIASAQQITGYENHYFISTGNKPYIDLEKIEQKEHSLFATYKRNTTAKALAVAGASATTMRKNTATNVDNIIDEVANDSGSGLYGNTVSLVNLFSADLIPAVDSLSGELHATLPNLLLTQGFDANRTLLNRLTTTVFKAGVWADWQAGKSKKTQAGFSTAKFNQNRMMLGWDHQIGAHLIGFGINSGKSIAKLGTAGRADLDSKGLFVYGKYRFNQPYLFGSFGSQINKVESERLMLNNIVKSDYRIRHTHLYGELGIEQVWKKINITPFIGYQYQHLKRDGFNEQLNFSIKSPAKKFDSHSMLAGLRMNYQMMNNLLLKMQFTQAYAIDPTSFDFDGNFNGSSRKVHIIGQKQDRYTSWFGLGLDYRLSHFNVSTHYDLGISNHNRTKEHNFSISGKYVF